MFGTLIRRKAAVVAAIAAAGMLGACISMPMPAPGPGFGDPGAGGGPPPPPEPQVETRTFNDPQVGGRWVDLCYAHGACRQQQQVDMFCQQQGYDRAISSYDRRTPILQTNVRLGDQSVCRSNGFNCNRVASITCERTR